MKMGGGRRNYSAWQGSKSCSSVNLLLLTLPLMAVAGLVSVWGPNPFGWSLVANQRFSQSSLHPSSSSSSLTTVVTTVEIPDSSGKQRERVLDLRSRVVVAVDDAHSKEEKAISDETAFNHSSAPPLFVQAIQSLQLPNKTEEILNISGRTDPMNESYVPIVTQRKERKISVLERTEGKLIQARAAIREARNGNQTQDPDYVPMGPMYWNAIAFHRSYLEMEKQFKVFVYEEGEPPVFHNGPCKSIYAMEGNFIHAIEINNQFRTRDPEKAHVFFLPFSVAMMVQFVYERDSRDFGPLRKTVRDYVNLISSRYPYWNRSVGADHFMLACHDWGPETSFSVPYMYKNSIRVLCNANTSEGFNPAKDVSFPEINLQTGTINGFVGGPSASRRPVLAFFAGGLHGPIRPILLEHWEGKDEDVQVHRYLPKGVSYYEMMRKSRYCLCPSGYEVASPRVVEAIYTGCVPVLISDHYVPPFSDILNWKSFSVEVSVKDIPNLKNILMSISTRQYIRKKRRVDQVRRHFEVHSPPKRFDVFHMILHSVWLRRLNIKVHDDH
ncbi:probable glycosyltransferase At5g03795 isoform X1 [Prosopis cineraria]|uniref:probable glycosyltransferase At5g03795 isoform X1 n=1 Tax=Prosopis cineraria TaxID=364024 RepID=UPI00240F5331|nr:probable glycosyltransferase At5g03795 isoform X1 [Prosopis cineraria]